MSNTLAQTSRFEEPLAQLRQARRDLMKEQGRIARELKAVEVAIRQLERIGRGGGSSGSPQNEETSTASEKRGEFDGMTMRQVARAVLARSSHPLSVREMLLVMQEAGRRPATRNAYHLVYKQLRTHSEFRNDNGRWFLVDAGNGTNGSHEAKT